MADHCIKRQLLVACRQAYFARAPGAGTEVGWAEPPSFITSGPNDIDRALVGRTAKGVVVAFRGTLAPFVKDDNPSERVALDWLNNAEFLPRENAVYPGRVHAGFAGSVDGLWDELAAEIRALLGKGGPATLFITGHSKGGALAALAGWRALAISELAPPVQVFTIAGARAGNGDFRTAYRAHGGIRCIRYEVALDIVPLVPLGTDTPPWARPLIRAAWPGLANINYLGVGTREPAGITGKEVLGALRHYFGGFAFRKVKGDFLTSLTAAHLIGPDSDYERLICRGGAHCPHG